MAVITSTSGTRSPRPRGAQRGPLLHPETVLLVDHHRAEGREPHALRQQRMGAHHEGDRTVGETREHAAPLGGGRAAGEERHLERPLPQQAGRIVETEAFEQGAHPGRMLFGEHLGGRHQRALVAGLHRSEQHRHRHHRLARTHVALQEPVHRGGAGHVGADLGHGPFLCGGERVREAGDEALHQAGPAGIGGLGVRDAGGGTLHLLLASHQRELDPEEFVEHQPVAGPLDVAEVLRGVDAPHRRPARLEVPALEDGRRHRVGDATGPAPAQRLRHPPGDLPRGEPGRVGLRVDRHDPAGAVAHEVDHRVRHLALALEQLHPAEHRHVHRGGAELALPPRLVEERAAETAAVVAHLGTHHHPAALHPA